MLMNHVNSCHGNNAFFIVRLSLSCTTKNSLHYRGTNKRFGTHEKLSWGYKLGQISPPPRVILIFNELKRFIYVNNTNYFKSSICSVLYTSVRLGVVITRKDHCDF